MGRFAAQSKAGSKNQTELSVGRAGPEAWLENDGLEYRNSARAGLYLQF